MLDVGDSLAALIELAPVGWIQVEAVGFSSTKARSSAATTTCGAFAATGLGCTGPSSQPVPDGVDKGVFSLLTERPTEVVLIQSPHQGATKTVLL